jgi:hypothetical protein
MEADCDPAIATTTHTTLQGAFQGLLFLVDVEEEVVSKIKEATCAGHLVDTSTQKGNLPPYSKALVAGVRGLGPGRMSSVLFPLKKTNRLLSDSCQLNTSHMLLQLASLPSIRSQAVACQCSSC